MKISEKNRNKEIEFFIKSIRNSTSMDKKYRDPYYKLRNAAILELKKNIDYKTFFKLPDSTDIASPYLYLSYSLIELKYDNVPYILTDSLYMTKINDIITIYDFTKNRFFILQNGFLNTLGDCPAIIQKENYNDIKFFHMSDGKRENIHPSEATISFFSEEKIILNDCVDDQIISEHNFHKNKNIHQFEAILKNHKIKLNNIYNFLHNMENEHINLNRPEIFKSIIEKFIININTKLVKLNIERLSKNKLKLNNFNFEIV